MWNYLLENKEWIFSGIGVSILTIIIASFLKKKKSTKKNFKNDNQFISSSFDNSSINNVKGDTINFNQTIVNKSKNKFAEKEKPVPIIATPEIAKAKQDFLEYKSKLRTNIYAALATAKVQKFDAIIEIRHVCDEVEELINVSHLETLNELKEMEQEGLIEFALKEDEPLISPYTRLITTKKFYDTIMDISS